MHELAITESILSIANQAAKENNGTKVTDIYLVIGQLSSIVDDSVQFYWDHISQGTVSEGAKLHFERRPAILHCKSCDHQYSLGEILQPCPNCHSVDVFIESGEELLVDHIDILREEE